VDDSTQDQATQAADGALDDLIAVERSVDADLAATQAEAERIVEAARTQAQSIREEGLDFLAAELDALRAAVDRDCEATLRRLDDEALTEETRYREVEESELAALARWVAERIVGGEKQP
jgi:F0F1-type ATP synthase membrane subunit b/b'